MASEGNRKAAMAAWAAYRESQLLHCGTEVHLSGATLYSREGEIDQKNKKTFRNKRAREQAKKMAEKRADGAFRVPTRFDDSDQSFAQKQYREKAA